MRVAYVTPFGCGSGHAVRGAALVRASGDLDLRAFGPPCADFPGYEGSDDWQDRVLTFKPELLIADLGWVELDELRATLGVPGWLLLRWVIPASLHSRGTRQLDRWERRISIEPAADGLPEITDSIPPIVYSNPADVPLVSDYDGQDVTLYGDEPWPVAPLLTRARSIRAAAGYNTYHESVWLGYRDRVRWLPDDEHLDRIERVRVGGEMAANGADVLMASLRRTDA